VPNQRIKRSGNVDQATGVAKGSGVERQAQGEPGELPGLATVLGDYLVIGLDEAYRWAVVSSPDRRYGWVLARSPQLDGQHPGVA